MLSILIPIYNQDVRKLVYTIAKQCNKLDINYQILCFDDGSMEKWKEKNKELAFKVNVNYTELSENLGRSKIRNWLGKAAYFEYILFLDGDSRILSRHFIQQYIAHLPSEDVIYGGRQYVKKKPTSTKKVLHWLYGTKREALSAKSRNKNPYLNFQSNNFLIPEKVFKDNLFDENVTGYGYEDLLYAVELQKKGIKIRHINNPIIHDGIETNTVFITKTKTSIQNLASLYQTGKITETRLTLLYEKLSYYKILPLFNWFSNKYKTVIENNISSNKPSILLFNLWKLHQFIQIIDTTKK